MLFFFAKVLFFLFEKQLAFESEKWRNRAKSIVSPWFETLEKLHIG